MQAQVGVGGLFAGMCAKHAAKELGTGCNQAARDEIQDMCKVVCSLHHCKKTAIVSGELLTAVACQPLL